MIKVITYGTYDLLHYGHIRLLERAKALGDYLIVGVTADDFDKTRGKINVQQSLIERVEAVKTSGIADEIIVEEYEGQKIDDIKRHDVDIFAIGSDWEGKFDYLNEYCKVVYLPRTEGISSSELRAKESRVRIGLVGDEEENILKKIYNECSYVNGVSINALWTRNESLKEFFLSEKNVLVVHNYDDLLENCEAVYIISHPSKHYEQVKRALLQGKHVLVEAPLAMNEEQCVELFEIAKHGQVVLMEAIKTAYSTAYNRLLLVVKSGWIGKVVSVDATCTSIRNIDREYVGYVDIWNSISAWGPTALLPVFQILGTGYVDCSITSLFYDKKEKFDAFTSINFRYKNAIASAKVGRGVKSEGELIVSGTKGYVYVPAPWWKTDYFEVRYENSADNRRYFYQLEGEGIRYELIAFLKSISTGNSRTYIEPDISRAICRVVDQYYSGEVEEIY